MAVGKSKISGRIALYPLLVIALLWPLVLNWHPFYAADSASYLRGGETGVNTGLLMLGEWWHGLFGAPAGQGAGSQGIAAAAVSQAGGTRSLVYSLFVYVLRMPGYSLFALVAFQAGVVALLVVMAQRLTAPRATTREQLVLFLCLALLTPVSWSAATAMPDIFAGAVVLGSILLTLYLERLGSAARVALVLLLVVAITAHSSHLPLALATLVTGAAARVFIRRPGLSEARHDALWMLTAPALALAAMLTLSYLAFGTLSIAPKRYPILLARSVADGPARLYLKAHCASERYAICEVFGTEFPTHPGTFLWSKDGVRYRATPEQMERIRREEGPIVRGAAAEYPLLQLRSSTRNFVQQFGSFGLGKVDFRATLAAGPTGRVELVEATEDRPLLRMWMTIVIYCAFAASLVILFLLRRRMSSADCAALVVAGVGLAANAAICGVLSGVADRYQARVAWTIPLLAMLILLRVRGDRPASAS